MFSHQHERELRPLDCSLAHAWYTYSAPRLPLCSVDKPDCDGHELYGVEVRCEVSKVVVQSVGADGSASSVLLKALLFSFSTSVLVETRLWLPSWTKKLIVHQLRSWCLPPPTKDPVIRRYLL